MVLKAINCSYAQRRICSSGSRNGLPKGPKMPNLSFNLTRIECRNRSSFIEDIQTILPLFQGNIGCLLPVVVPEYLYL